MRDVLDYARSAGFAGAAVALITLASAGHGAAQTPAVAPKPTASAPAVAPPGAPTVIPTYIAMDVDTLSKIILSQTQAQLTPDSSNPQGPIIKVQQVNGVSYSAFMDDCDGGQPNLCKSLEFRAMLPAGSLNFSQINSFNQNMRYATAYLGEKGVPELRMDLSLRGGITANTVAFTVRIFNKVLADYIQQAK